MRKHLILCFALVLSMLILGCDALTTSPSTIAETSTADMTSMSSTAVTTPPSSIQTTNPMTTSILTTTTIPTTTTAATTAAPTYSLLSVQADFDQFVTAMARNPRVFTDAEELALVLATQRAALYENMTAFDFYRVMTVAMAAYRCGHSFIQVPPTVMDDIFAAPLTFPIEARLFAGKLMVVSVEGESTMEVGDEIVSIDGVSVAAITQSMMPYLSADGVGTSLKTIVLAQSFLSYYLLFLAEDDILAIEFFDADTASTQTETIERDTVNTSFWEPFASIVSTFFEGYAVLTVQSFQPMEDETLASMNGVIDAFFTRVEEEDIGHVILDLRGNGGGDPRPASHLFSHLAAYSQPYFRSDAPSYYAGLKYDVPLSTPHFDGTVTTLIDGYCFSTCGHFAALLQFQDIGTFIGTETGGSFVCSDGSGESLLSRTRIRFRTSTMIWGVAVEGFTLGRGIEPDIPLETTFEDYLAGIDTVMAAAVALIEADLHP